MCYAFSGRCNDVLSINTDNVDIVKTDAISQGTDQPPSETTPRKRSASTSLEHEPTKAAKLSSDGGTIDITDRSETTDEVASKTSGLSILLEQLSKANQEIERLKDDNTKLKNKANQDVEHLEHDVAKAKFEYHQEKVRAIEAEDEVKELNTKLKTRAPNYKPGADLSKKLEDDIKAKYDKKAKAQQTKHDERFQKLRDDYQRKLNELRETQKEKVDELKETDQEREKEWKAFRNQHQKLQKDLQAEQQAKIREAQPELKRAIKEANENLKESQHKIAELKGTITEMRGNETKLKYEVEALDAAKKALQDALRVKGAENTELEDKVQARTELIEKVQGKLSHEGERWRLEHNKAEKLAQTLVHQQRTNFILRNSHNRNTARIEELEVELHAAKERNITLTNSVTSAPETLIHLEAETNAIDEKDEVKYLGDWSACDPETVSSVMTAADVRGFVESSVEDVALLGEWSAGAVA